MTTPTTDAREREAKPCPWCGSTVTPIQKETDGAKWGALACAECGAIGPETRTGYGPFPTWYADALKEWNDRPAEAKAIAAERARVRAVVENERLTDDTGHPQDIAYNQAIADVLAALQDTQG